MNHFLKISPIIVSMVVHHHVLFSLLIPNPAVRLTLVVVHFLQFIFCFFSLLLLFFLPLLFPTLPQLLLLLILPLLPLALCQGLDGCEGF